MLMDRAIIKARALHEFPAVNQGFLLFSCYLNSEVTIFCYPEPQIVLFGNESHPYTQELFVLLKTTVSTGVEGLSLPPV